MRGTCCGVTPAVSILRLVRFSKQLTDRRSNDQAERNAKANRQTASDHGTDHNADHDADPDRKCHKLQIVIHLWLSLLGATSWGLQANPKLRSIDLLDTHRCRYGRVTFRVLGDCPGPCVPDDQSVEYEANSDQEVVVDTVVGQTCEVE